MEITVGRGIRLWWVFVLRGILFLLLGIYLLAAPVSGLIALGFTFGLIIFLAGIADLLRAYQDRDQGDRGWHLFTGIIDLILGIILMTHLGASITILRIVIGFYFLFRGLIIFSFRKAAGGSWWVILGALITLLFVGMIWFNPVFGSMTLVLWVALAFLITGILNIMLGLRLK
ncbi:uncharacterized membrane protein HdeD (DUF308 family) [Mucilaginibacter yixingensis]|uniref:Uncharacterized membrane protein HdeD (DUF308 family) n=1 Tax=Mucilaginibacter yixingensis TaxID=1295612 RepID=A0A2T5J5N5_9SPHI|nr:DUF308 domain-containing protein [Mucilaginibacter yixingensis]PTQ93576.1 uncharacterized membrane protein HdeD (DUF308 family) [Mucilaginibacter yixingensis]